MNNHIKMMVAAIGTLTAFGAQAQILFQNPDDLEDAYYSYSGDYVAADHFSIASGGSVGTVDWTGVDLGGVSEFTLSIYSDVAGEFPSEPGTLLDTVTVAGNAGEAPNGNLLYGSFPVDAYSTTLSTPFTAAPGTEYWLSIEANNAWAWDTSHDGTGYMVDDYPPNTEYDFTASTDLAFTLIGSSGGSAPDGGTTALLLGLACTGLGFAKRKLR